MLCCAYIIMIITIPSVCSFFSLSSSSSTVLTILSSHRTQRNNMLRAGGIRYVLTHRNSPDRRHLVFADCAVLTADRRMQEVFLSMAYDCLLYVYAYIQGVWVDQQTIRRHRRTVPLLCERGQNGQDHPVPSGRPIGRCRFSVGMVFFFVRRS